MLVAFDCYDYFINEIDFSLKLKNNAYLTIIRDLETIEYILNNTNQIDLFVAKFMYDKLLLQVDILDDDLNRYIKN